MRNNRNTAGIIGSLALSVVRPGAPTIGLRALRWQCDLESIGVRLPFFVVHDIGILFAIPRGNYAIGFRVDTREIAQQPRAQEQYEAYLAFVNEIASCEASRRAANLRLSDHMVCTILCKLLAKVSSKTSKDPDYQTSVVFDAALFDGIDSSLVSLFREHDRSFELDALSALVIGRLYVLTVADALDLDTLQLLGVLGTASSNSAALLVDMLAAVSSPAAHDVVNFSLEILPSVLETKTRPGASTRAGFGYSGVGTRGTLGDLCLTELAWDDEDFVRRVQDNEVLYYTREVEREPSGKRHVLLIDASASMRGDRQVFARGLALATAKKLLLEGESVTVRFFDARLYEPRPAQRDNLPTPYVLSFVGERGRNARQAFSELITSLNIEAANDQKQVILHVFTHAALYVPRDVVQALSKIARLDMVFILPSGGSLELDYLDLLSSHHVVDYETLVSRSARANKARELLVCVGDEETVSHEPR